MPKVFEVKPEPRDTWRESDPYADQFNFEPEELDAHWLKTFGIKRSEILTRFLFDFPRDIAIAEFGCSCGNQLVMLKQLGFTNLSGVDICPHAVYLARMRGLNVSTSDITVGTPIPTGTVDLVFTCGVLSHIPPFRLVAACAEMIRASNGKRILTTEYTSDHTPGFCWVHDYVTPMQSLGWDWVRREHTPGLRLETIMWGREGRE